MIQIRVLLFAELRERFNESEFMLQLSPQAKLIEVLEKIFPESAERHRQLSFLRLAVNHEFASPETILQDQDEVALLPPMSGG